MALKVITKDTGPGRGWPTRKNYMTSGGVYVHNGGGAHPGFKAVQARIAAKEGLSMDRAGAILAASSRGASAKAKKANPRLKRVKG